MSAIPLRNLYVMLAFAGLDAGTFTTRDIGACDFDQEADILAHLVNVAMRRLFHRGLHRDYMEVEEEGTLPRGRIDMGQTVGRQLTRRGRLAYAFDERLPDTDCNRVLRAGLRVLMGASSVRGGLKVQLRRHLLRLDGVRDLDTRTALHLQPAVPRGLALYHPALQLAQLALRRALPDEGQAGDAWKTVARDEYRLADVFERFVRGFASYALAERARVSVKHLRWEVSQADEHRARRLLPQMRTDVFIDWASGPPTVGECKFYKNPLSKSHHGIHERLRSGHLYQLLSYLRAVAREHPTRPSGLLIYAQVDEPLWERWTLEGFPFAAVGVDLAQPWPDLRDTLTRAVELFAPHESLAKTVVPAPLPAPEVL